MAQDISQQLWAQYTNQIASQMGAGAGSANIQVLPSAQLLYGKSDSDYTTAIQRFASLIPQWGAVYNPSTETVVDAYQTVLTQIKETATNGTSIEAEYTAQNQKLSDMMGKASAFKVGKIKSWKSDCADYTDAGLTPPAFTDWFKDNGQQEYQVMLDAQTHQTTVVETLLSAAGIASPLVAALAALNTTLQSNIDKTSMPLTLNPDVSLLTGWATHPTNAQTIAFSDSSTQYDYSQTIWQSQSGTKLFGFISIGHRSSSSTQTNIFNSSTQYSIQIDFAAQASFDIAQSASWFNGAILKNYKNGPWIDKSQFATASSHPYGDAAAVFPLLVTRMYVVLNPTITITQQKNESNQLFSQLNDQYADGVNLGGFAFGGSESSSSNIQQHNTTDANTMKIVITDTSNVPQIIAVANELMP